MPISNDRSMGRSVTDSQLSGRGVHRRRELDRSCPRPSQQAVVEQEFRAEAAVK